MVAVHIYKHTLHYNYLVALETVSAFSYLGKALGDVVCICNGGACAGIGVCAATY